MKKNIWRFVVVATLLLGMTTLGAAGEAFISDTDTFSSSGSYNLDVSSYQRLNVTLKGAGGGECSGYSGGEGGYSFGRVNVTGIDTLYLYVGGAGESYANEGAGGFNGGGSGNDYESDCYGGGGGGTDLRTQDSLGESSSPHRFLVAGGGGGADSYEPVDGAPGGGATGAQSRPNSGWFYGEGQNGGGGGWYGGVGDEGQSYQGGTGAVYTESGLIISGYTQVGGGSSGGNDGSATIEYITVNSPSQFNSSSISPDLPEIGNPVSYSAEAYDSDGTVSDLELTVFKDGSQVFTDSVSQASYTWSDVFVPESSGDLDARFTVTDDAGASTTEWLNRTLTNTAPGVSLDDPGTQFTYDVPLSFSVDDSGDSYPNEDLYCEVFKDGQLDRNVSGLSEVDSYSESLRSDLGGHSVSVECSDPAGNTGTASQSYTVKAFEILDVFSPSQTYETENTSYDVDIRTGSMVNSADIKLEYSGSSVSNKVVQNSGVSVLQESLYHRPGLVSSNSTSQDWHFNVDLNLTDYSSGFESASTSSSVQSQSVLWSYFFESSETSPASGKYIEKEDLKHVSTLNTHTKQGEIQAETTYSKNGKTVVAEKIAEQPTFTQYEGVIPSGLVENGNTSSYNIETSATVSFRDNNRTVTTSDSVQVYRKVLTGCNTGLDTAESLRFDTDYEEENYDVQSSIFMTLEISKVDHTREYSFSSENKSEHSFCIYPSWASYTVTTDDTRIQYQGTDDSDLVKRSYFFPLGQEISNSTTEVPLLLINRSETIEVKYELYDQNGQAVSGAVCRIDRSFPGSGTHETVSMIRTGANGETRTYLEVNEISYRHICYKNGEIFAEFGDQIINQPMILKKGSDTSPGYLSYISLADAQCSMQGNTSLSCEYASDDESLQNMELNIDRLEPVQNQNVCRVNSSSLTGTLSCDGLNISKHSYKYTVNAHFPGQSIVADSGYLGSDNSGYGMIGVFITVLLVIFVFLATAWNVILGVSLAALVFYLSSLMNLMPLTPSQKASLIGIVVLVAAIASKRTGL